MPLCEWQHREDGRQRSGNRTNFVGAEKEIKQLVSQLDHDQIQRMKSNHGVDSHFNPPVAPHFGGVFEGMIKSAKRAISCVLKVTGYLRESFFCQKKFEAKLNITSLASFSKKYIYITNLEACVNYQQETFLK